jgi:hypothetical protein
MDILPHYANEDWHEIFEHPPYMETILNIQKGSRILTDFDHTAYHADAGIILLDAAAKVGLISQERAKTLLKLKKKHQKHLEGKKIKNKENFYQEKNAQKELQYYKEGLGIFSEVRLKDLEELAHTLWFKGIPNFLGGKALFHSIYPEMAYLYAVAKNSQKKTKKNQMAAVSASPDFALVPILTLLSFDQKNLCAMQMELELKTGRLTQRFKNIVYGASKISAAKKIIPNWDFAFGDNPRNDGEFLKIAQKGAFGIGKEMLSQNGHVFHEGKLKLQYLPLKTPPLAI